MTGWASTCSSWLQRRDPAASDLRSPRLPRNSHPLGDAIAIALPRGQRFLAYGHYALGHPFPPIVFVVASGAEDDAPGVRAMSALDRCVGEREAHRLGSAAVVHDERVPSHRDFAAGPDARTA